VIRTRDAKAVKSHAQKFLVRLVKLLNKEDSGEHLNLQEAEYFYGVLNEKTHWRTKRKQEEVLKKRANLEQGKIFIVEKVDRYLPAIE